MWKRYSPVNGRDTYKNECIDPWWTGSPKDQDGFRVILAPVWGRGRLTGCPRLLWFSDTGYRDHNVNSSLLVSAQNFPFITWLTTYRFYTKVRERDDHLDTRNWIDTLTLTEASEIWVRELALPFPAVTCSRNAHAWSREFMWSFWLCKIKVKMK